MKPDSVSIEGKSTQSINTAKLNTVENPAQCRLIGVKRITLDGVEDVYNMEVEKNHNFAVNGGYIVHNCMDAIRYLCYTLHITKKQSEYMASLD